MSKPVNPPPNHKVQKFYIEKHDITPLVLIYKGTHSPNYYVRFSTMRGYVTKSLHTQDFEVAKVRAAEMEQQTLRSSIAGLSTKQTIRTVTEWYSGTETFLSLQKGRQRQIIRIMKVYSDYFGNREIQDIMPRNWSQYWEFRTKYYDGMDHPSIFTRS